MKAWALVALVAAESGLRGHPVLVVHHKPHRASLLQRGSHSAVRHARTGGVDLSTLSGGDVATSGIIQGAGAYPEESTGAAAPAAPPSGPAAAPAAAPADDDAASVVFGGAGEAPTREELRIVHEQQMAKAAAKAPAKAPAPPFKVTLDLGPPPPLPSEPAAPAAPAPIAAAPVAPAAPPASMLHTDAQVQHAQTQQQVQQQMVRMEQQAQAHVAAQTETQASATPTGITRPKGWDQCLKFSRFIKAQGVTGMELVKTWKATCEPAVSSGVATERYKVMCNALGGTVEPFAAQQDYDVEKLCDAVLAVFHDVTAVDVKASS